MLHTSHTAHSKLVEELADRVAADWESVGIGLVGPKIVRNLIAGERSGCQNKLDLALERWLDVGKETTVEKLIKAVRSPAVGPNEPVAQELERERGTCTTHVLSRSHP